MNCRDWRWTLEPRGPHFSPLGRLGGSGPPAPPSSAHRAAEAAFPGPGRGIRSAAGVAPQDRSGLVRAQSSPLARRRGDGRRGAPRREPEKGAGHPETRPSLFREGQPRRASPVESGRAPAIAAPGEVEEAMAGARGWDDVPAPTRFSRGLEREAVSEAHVALACLTAMGTTLTDPRQTPYPGAACRVWEPPPGKGVGERT